MLITILGIIIAFSLLILFHEFGHFLSCKIVGVRVERFSLGLGPKLFGVGYRGTEYCLSAVPFGGYIRMTGEDPQEKLRGTREEFLSRDVRTRFFIILAGPLANFTLAFLFFSLVFALGTSVLPPEVGEVAKNSPAAAAGLKVGDRIVAINEKEIKCGEDMQKIVFASPGKELQFIIQRNTQKFTLPITPELKDTKNIFGQEEKIGLIGISFPKRLIKVRYGVGKAALKGWEKTLTMTGLILKGFKILIRGKASLKGLAGPVFIAQAAGQAARMGFATFLNFIAFVSINLFVINLLPIPVLDGGHIVFLAVEGIRKKPVSLKIQEIAQQIGLAILLSLAIFVIYNDLLRMWSR